MDNTPANPFTRGGRLMDITGHVLTVAGLLLAALLIHSILQNQPTPVVVALGKPKVVTLAAATCLVAGAALRAWRRRALATLISRLVLLGFSLAVALFAAELVVRDFLNRRQGESGTSQLLKWAAGGTLVAQSFTPLLAICQLSGNHRLIYELKPNLDLDFGHHSLHTNSRGMRDSGEYEPGATGTLRIVGIGDSGMFGWGVNQDEDYLSVLETNLNAAAAAAAGPRVEVLNFGIPGYNTGQELELLRSRALAFKPHVVVVGWCDNDFGPPFLVTRREDYSKWRNSFLYDLLFYRNEVFNAPVCKPAELDARLIDPVLLEYTDVRGVRRAFTELRELARRDGFDVLVFGPMRAEAVAICRELGLEYFDTNAGIDATRYPEDYAVHFMHPAAGGHRVLAEHLQVELQQRNWLRAR